MTDLASPADDLPIADNRSGYLNSDIKVLFGIETMISVGWSRSGRRTYGTC